MATFSGWIPTAPVYSDATWQQWNTSASTTTYYTTELWVSWTTNSTGATYNYQTSQSAVPTAAQLEADKERRAAAVARNKKAEGLLLSLLDEEQAKELTDRGFFHVHTKKGKRTYRITKQGHIDLVKSENGTAFSYCIHPRDSYPDGDKAAALKLMVEADEALFLKTANATPRAAVAA